nr:RNA-directed DNA polymerase, eukaryota [Tanacetum cinerariifolium]
MYMQAVEAVDRTIQDVTMVKLLFAGKITVLREDFRQLLLVVRYGTRAKIVDSSCNHFATRFQDPDPSRGCLNFDFPFRLNDEQNSVLESLTAFLPNRQILDGPFIVNEILSRCKAKNHQAMFFKASILVNGSPTAEFQFHRGLKQGDPLAPFLFILVMKSLHLSFSRAVEAGIFTGIKIDSSLTLSHHFYADDTVSIGEWSNGGNMSLVKEWDESIAKLKKSCLSESSRLYQLGDALLFLRLCLGRLLFIICHSLRFPNRALIFKWVWRFLSHDKSLWFWVISALHGSNLMAFSTSYSSIWSTIIKEVNSLKAQGVDLLSHCKVWVGNGLRTSFWNDPWIGDTLLKHLFPRLYALEVS